MTVTEVIESIKSDRRKQVAVAVAALVAVAIFYQDSEPAGTIPAVSATSWTCQSLVAPVMEMSKGKTPEILELTNVVQTDKYLGSITCQGTAEWSQGEGGAEFGAHTSEGGSVILSYKQL